MQRMNASIAPRRVDVEGVDVLYWIKEDSGAFVGPLQDWKKSSKKIMSQCKGFNTVIQAGGNCGMYPRFYGNHFINVYTFEPDSLNYLCLDLNCIGSKYRKFYGGLGDNTNRLSLKRHALSNCGMHRIDTKPGNIEMFRIDDLSIVECDLIHLDVEGFEEQALRGGEKTIKKYKPVVVLEHGGRQQPMGHEYILSLKYEVYSRERMDTIYIPKEK